MKKYEVLFPNNRIKNRFRKELDRIPLEDKERIKEKVESLSRVPRPQGKIFKYLRPPIQIYDLTAQYRIRIGDYRILYDVDDTTKKVWILAMRKKGKGTYK